MNYDELKKIRIEVGNELGLQGIESLEFALKIYNSERLQDSLDAISAELRCISEELPGLRSNN